MIATDRSSRLCIAALLYDLHSIARDSVPTDKQWQNSSKLGQFLCRTTPLKLVWFETEHSTVALGVPNNLHLQTENSEWCKYCRSMRTENHIHRNRVPTKLPK